MEGRKEGRKYERWAGRQGERQKGMQKDRKNEDRKGERQEGWKEVEGRELLRTCRKRKKICRKGTNDVRGGRRRKRR